MEGEDERDSMARFRREAEQTSRPPKRGWRGSPDHAFDLWERFTAGSGWQKSRLGIAAFLIIGVVITAIYLLASNAVSGGGQQQVVAVRSQATPTVAQALPTATSILIAVPTPLPARPTDRTDCDAIRGTNYNSEAERAFFQQNCVAPTEEPANVEDGQGFAVNTPPPPPPTEPSGSGGLSAGDAIDLAVSWITHDAPERYTADPGSCSSRQTAGHWLVTCTASLVGCQGAVCRTTLSVCVFAEPVEVRSSDQC